MSNTTKAMYYEGIAVAGGEILPYAINFEISHNITTIEHKRGDGGGTIPIPAGVEVKGSVTFKEMNATIFAMLTGGTVTAGSHKRIRYGEETAIITSTQITLAETGNVIKDTIKLVGGKGTIFKRVASTPAIGEYSYDEGRCEFNASETDINIFPSYLAIDKVKGNTVSFGRSLPSNMEFWGTMRIKDVDADRLGDSAIHLTKIIRGSELKLGGESGGSTSEFAFEFYAITTKDTDAQISFPI